MPVNAIRAICAVVMLGLASAIPARAAGAGQRAPPFALAGADGPVSLESLRGRVVYVDFWASWCAPCRRSFPWMNGLNRRYRSAGLAIVGIDVDTRHSDAERFLRETPADFTIVYDASGSTPAAYDVKGMPSAYLIDRHGVIDRVDEGFHDAGTAGIEARIRELLAQP